MKLGGILSQMFGEDCAYEFQKKTILILIIVFGKGGGGSSSHNF